MVAGFGPRHHAANNFGPAVRAVAFKTKLVCFTKRATPKTTTATTTATNKQATTSDTKEASTSA